MPSAALQAAETKIIVIGCGEWNPIETYAGMFPTIVTRGLHSGASSEITGFQGSIFADPGRTLYHALGMDIENLSGTPAGEQRRSYRKKGFFANVVLSIWVLPSLACTPAS